MSIIKQMRGACQPKTKRAGFLKVWIGEHWFGAYIARHFSIYITWLFVKLGFSANMVTFMMIILGLAGSALLVVHILWMNMLGFLLLILAETFDYVDGEVARWKNECSVKGYYLDLVSHVLCNSVFYIFCALHLYVLKREAIYLVLAFVSYAASHCVLCLSYVFQIIKLWCDSKHCPDLSESTNIGYHEHTSFRKSKFWIMMKVGGYSTDIVVVMFISAASIFMSYTGTIVPMIAVAWFVAVSQGLLVAGRIWVKFFRQLPDMSHMRKMGFE